MHPQKFYRKEYKRLLKENGELWEENQKIKKSYDALKAKVSFVWRLGASFSKRNIILWTQFGNLWKNDAKQLQDLMKLVTGEMGSALNMMEKAKEEGAEDMKPLE